jgi:hypothetical protein
MDFTYQNSDLLFLEGYPLVTELDDSFFHLFQEGHSFHIFPFYE